MFRVFFVLLTFYISGDKDGFHGGVLRKNNEIYEIYG